MHRAIRHRQIFLGGPRMKMKNWSALPVQKRGSKIFCMRQAFLDLELYDYNHFFCSSDRHFENCNDPAPPPPRLGNFLVSPTRPRPDFEFFWRPRSAPAPISKFFWDPDPPPPRF